MASNNPCVTHQQDVIHPYFENSAQFLPSIQCEKDKFPSRRNLHHRRLFVRYITNKMEKEHELLSMLAKCNAGPSQASGTIKAAPLNAAPPPRTRKPKALSAKSSRLAKESTYITTASKESDSQDYYDTRNVFAAPPPPPPSAKFR